MLTESRMYLLFLYSNCSNSNRQILILKFKSGLKKNQASHIFEDCWKIYYGICYLIWKKAG